MIAEDGAPAQGFLNQALKEDALDDSYILRISIYYASGRIEHGSLNEGQHRRVSAYQGFVKLDDVLRAEVLGEQKLPQSDETLEEGGENWDSETLVEREPELAQEPSKSKPGEEIASFPRRGRRAVKCLLWKYLDLRASEIICGGLCEAT